MCSYVFTLVPSSYMFFLQMPCKLLLRYCASSKCCWQESPCTLSWGSFAEALSGSDVRDWVLALNSNRIAKGLPESKQVSGFHVAFCFGVHCFGATICCTGAPSAMETWGSCRNAWQGSEAPPSSRETQQCHGGLSRRGSKLQFPTSYLNPVHPVQCFCEFCEQLWHKYIGHGHTLST